VRRLAQQAEGQVRAMSPEVMSSMLTSQCYPPSLSIT
jgi:hypothetical protein